MRRTLSGASKDERLAARYIPKGSTRVALKDGSAVVYLSAKAGRFYAIGYRGTAGKPDFHHSYRTEASRTQAVQQFFAGVRASAEFKAKRNAERKASGHTFKAGDIVNTSWGYDQTNVDFYIVTRVSAACVWVRPVAADRETTGFMSGRTWPAMPIRYTGEESRHVARGGYFSIKGHSASLTTGDKYESWYA